MWRRALSASLSSRDGVWWRARSRHSGGFDVSVSPNRLQRTALRAAGEPGALDRHEVATLGSAFSFECPSCGYTAEVSGGRDLGMFVVVRTCTCGDCHRLVDVIIGYVGQDGGIGVPKYDRALDRCPECDGTNLVPWSEAWPCPRCGSSMIQGDTLILWD